ncbi:MAG: hypothetical protein EOP05_02425 [Proteobacteria bacterium]|nr:MAG: hypothetical protein EOP05_02425 [Pseudomonadota bacterium]
MTRAKFWTTTISATVVMGLLIAGAQLASKDSTKESNRNARLARLQTLLDEGKAEYRPSIFRKKIKASVEQVAGLADTSTVTEIAPVKPKDAKDEKKVAKKDDKKKDSKDKKKKKKKKKKTKANGEPETAPDDSSDEEEAGDEVAATGAGAGPGANTPAAAAGLVNNNPQTADEWFRYLQANLDFEHVSKFIQLAQTGELKSEIFYETIEKMLLDSNTRMHQFGVLALGSTPSQTSFTLLADVSVEQSMEAKVKSQASTYMRMYTRLEYVGHLGNVVAMDTDLTAGISALRLMEDSAAQHLKNVASTTPGSSGTEPERTPASNVTKTFDTIVASLTKVSATAQNATLREQATLTLQRLRGLLGNA